MRFLLWRIRHISQRRLILILSVFVGFITGLVAVLLKNATHYVQAAISSGYITDFLNPVYFLFPIFGILITLLIKKLIKGKVSEGIPETLLAISRKGGILEPYKMYASVITSIITVGFGGSVGLEGPAVSTGSAIGSNVGRVMGVNYKSKILLISCASAGAIASIFNAPIAAIIFTIEIFSLDFTLRSLIPLLLSSISGAVTSIFLQGSDHLFHYNLLTGFRLSDLPYYIILGAFTALVSVYFTKTYIKTDALFSKIKSPVHRTLIGVSLLGLLIFIFPPLFGEGYETINHLLNGRAELIMQQTSFFETDFIPYFSLIILLILILMKAVATSLTLASGGVGGIFAPSLFTGATLGYLFSSLINDFNLGDLPESNFTLVGMAGLMAGVLHAPLTAVFLIAEVTGGYELFLPLMAVSAISFLITNHFMEYSFYTHEVAKKGALLTHDKDHAVLTLLSVNKVLENNFSVIRPNMSLRELIEVVKSSHRNLFPVLNENQELVGILTLDDIRTFMFDEELYDALVVAELMHTPPDIISIEEDMNSVMKKFQDTGAWNLPVVDANNHYIGFVSKSKLFSAYRNQLIELSVG